MDEQHIDEHGQPDDGYELPQRTALLDFQGGPHQGAEVRCVLDVEIGTLLWFESMQRMQGNVAEVARMFQRFGDEFLVSWNLTRGGEPLPASGAGMLRVTPAFAMALVDAWMRAVAEVPLPLGSPSSAGATSAARSMNRAARRSASRSRRS